MKLKLLHETREISPTSAIILTNSANEVLILKRGDTAPWMPNKWSLPGGGIDEGETPEAAAVRECEEETSLTPRRVKFYDKIQYPSYVLYLFTGTSDDVPRLNWENTEYAFVNKEQIADYAFVPGIAKILSNYL